MYLFFFFYFVAGVVKIQRCHTERISDPTTFSVFTQFAFHVQ